MGYARRTGGQSVTVPDERYLGYDYVNENPSWDMEDSPWKASLVTRVLKEHQIYPSSICDIGCGAGDVLAELRKSYARAELAGFDIAPTAARFWHRHDRENIAFSVGDFLSVNRRSYDVILVLDVIEHVRDPIAFLSGLSSAARYYVLHIPLDLSALSVIRESPLLAVRHKVGHIHYFTKNVALSMIEESGLRTICYGYTGAGFSAPRRTWRTKVAMVPRWLLNRLNKDWAVRLLGGETLIVLAVPADARADATT